MKTPPWRSRYMILIADNSLLPFPLNGTPSPGHPVRIRCDDLGWMPQLVSGGRISANQNPLSLNDGTYSHRNLGHLHDAYGSPFLFNTNPWLASLVELIARSFLSEPP